MVVGETKSHWIVILLIFLTILVSTGCVDLRCSYIPDSILTDGWYENTALRNTGIQTLGLEKWCNIIYEIGGKYPAFLSITTIKTLLMINEKELQNRIIVTIEETFNLELVLSQNSTGRRMTSTNHQSIYQIYNGIEQEKLAKVKIIGEVWNCGDSGSSIMCIGIAYINNSENPLIDNTENWEKIVMDPSGTIENHTGVIGLIYNIRCH